MSAVEDDVQPIDRLNDALKQLEAATPDNLVRREHLGDRYSFDENRQLFEDVLQVANLLRDTRPLKHASPDLLQRLADSTEEVLRSLRAFMDFDAERATPDITTARGQLARGLEGAYNAFYKVAAPAIAFQRSLEIDQAALKRRLESELQGFRITATGETSAISAMKEEVEQMVNAVRTAATEAGIEHHEAVFNKEATNHTYWARWWLCATAALATLTATFAWSLVNQHLVLSNPEATVAASLQLALAKALLFSVLYFALVGSWRAYRAHRHNAIVNAHRRNALKTFQAFVKGAEGDADIKNAVLLRATETIFAPAVSGYLSREPEPQGSMQVLEIIRNLYPGGPPK